MPILLFERNEHKAISLHGNIVMCSVIVHWPWKNPVLLALQKSITSFVILVCVQSLLQNMFIVSQVNVIWILYFVMLTSRLLCSNGDLITTCLIPQETSWKGILKKTSWIREITKTNSFVYCTTKSSKTRMHSSTMGTARSLTVSLSVQYGRGGLPNPPGGKVRPPWMQTSFAGGN